MAVNTAAVQPETDDTKITTQPAAPAQTAQPVQPAAPAQTVQPEFFSAQTAAPAAAKAKKKSPVLAIVIIAAVVVIAAMAGCFFLFKAPITRLFMGNENYANMVMTDCFDNLSDTLGTEESLMLASAVKDMDLSADSSDSTETVGKAVDAVGAAFFAATGGKGASVDHSVKITIDNEKEFVKIFGEEAVKALGEIELDTYAVRTGFYCDSDSYQAVLALLKDGSATMDAQVYYGAEGDAYISFPSLSDKSVKFDLPKRSISIDSLSNAKENETYRNIKNKFSEILKEGEVKIGNESVSLGSLSFEGQVVEVTLGAEEMAEFLEEAQEELCDMLDLSSSEIGLTEVVNGLKGNENASLVLRAFVHNNGSVAGSSVEIQVKENGEKHSITAGWIKENYNLAAEVTMDKDKLLSLSTDNKSATEGVLNLNIFPVVGSNKKFTLKVDYSGLGIASLFGKRIITGSFEISLSIDESLTSDMDPSAADIIGKSKLKLSIKPENGGIAYGIGLNYSDAGSLEYKALITETGSLISKPTGSVIESDDEEALKELGNEIIEKISGDSANPLADSMKGYTTASKITSADSTAASIKNNIDCFLTEADTNGYGMKMGSSMRSIGTVAVRDGVWEVKLSDISCFKNRDNYTWTDTGRGSAGDSKSGVTSPTSMLAIDLANLFPDVKNADIVFSLVGGDCKSVAYSEGTQGILLGTDCPNITENGNWQNYSFPWDGKNAGVTGSGRIVGTSPKAYLDLNAVPYDEPNMNGRYDTMKMPNLKGMDYNDVLSSYGDVFEINVIEEGSTEPKGTVTNQSITGGENVNKGDYITIYVSNGSQPEGKMLNIYCWNEELKESFLKYYTLPEGIIVNWIINPTYNGVFQEKLDEALINNETARPDDKVDLFVAEPDYIKKYVDSDYTLDLAEIGFTTADTEYAYNVSLTTSYDGKRKGVSCTTCPSALIYRRSIAKDVFGTDDPDEVQALLSDWDKFNEAAKKVRDYGYYMTPAYAETYRAFSGGANAPWYDENYVLTIPGYAEEWADQTYDFLNSGSTLTDSIWGTQKFAQMCAEGKTLCFFGPEWYYDYCMMYAYDDSDSGTASYGDWAICEGPQAHFWGGTFLLAAVGTDNPGTVAAIMNDFTRDEELLTNLVVNEGIFVNNISVNEGFADSSNPSNSFLGGQNDMRVLCDIARHIWADYVTSVDYVLNEYYQSNMLDYFEGRVTKEKAIDNFYGQVMELYPILSRPYP